MQHMHETRGNRHAAFTLIELLVVVAVIAILAAIAVPNFLEAQVRAKVSRAKADMRSIVGALEAYRVDNNGYPTYHYANCPDSAFEFHIGGKVPAWSAPDPDWNGMNPITTPIAYISKMPTDPFAAHRTEIPAELREYLYTNWTYGAQAVTEPFHSIFLDAKEVYGDYRLHSRGPDLKGPDSGLPYDPTNGTVSRGDITYGPKTGFDRLDQFVPDQPQS